MSEKKKVLFVDDEPRVLDGLRRMLRPLRHEWEMSFAISASDALEILSQKPYDVIVTDMRMPGMDGAELLKEVKKRYPHMVRFVLSGQANQETMLRSIGPMHQYLSKPCDAKMLKSSLSHSCELRSILSNEKLQDLVSQIDTLPSLPSLYMEMVEELQKPEASMKLVGKIISKDMSMSAKILQLVNSAFFGVRRHISNPDLAVTFLGLDMIKMLFLTLEVFSQFKRKKPDHKLLNTLWDHSITVGSFAKKIAETEDAGQKVIDHACMAGLLHDLGKLVLSAELPDKYVPLLSFAAEEGVDLFQLESEMLGATHAEVGAYLLGIWGLSDPIVESLAFHHCPKKHLCKEFNSVSAVHVANVLGYKFSLTETVEAVPEIDHEYLAELGLEERLPVWEKACQKIIEEAASQKDVSH